MLKVLASSSNPQQIIERLRNSEPIESVYRHVTTCQAETNAKHDFPGNVSACLIEQSYAKQLELTESQESVSSITGPPSLANSDGASSLDTVFLPSPTWPTPFTPTSDDLEKPPIIENTKQK